MYRQAAITSNHIQPEFRRDFPTLRIFSSPFGRVQPEFLRNFTSLKQFDRPNCPAYRGITVQNNFENKLSTAEASAGDASFLAEISVSSPRKLFILIIQKKNLDQSIQKNILFHFEKRSTRPREMLVKRVEELPFTHCFMISRDILVQSPRNLFICVIKNDKYRIKVLRKQ